MNTRFRLPFDSFVFATLYPPSFDTGGLTWSILTWVREFGRPASDREWLDALEAGLIEPSYDD